VTVGTIVWSGPFSDTMSGFISLAGSSLLLQTRRIMFPPYMMRFPIAGGVFIGFSGRGQVPVVMPSGIAHDGSLAGQGMISLHGAPGAVSKRSVAMYRPPSLGFGVSSCTMIRSRTGGPDTSSVCPVSTLEHVVATEAKINPVSMERCEFASSIPSPSRPTSDHA